MEMSTIIKKHPSFRCTETIVHIGGLHSYTNLSSGTGAMFSVADFLALEGHIPTLAWHNLT